MQRFDNLDLSRNLTKIRAEKAGYPPEHKSRVFRFVVWLIDEDDDGKPIKLVEDIHETQGYYIKYFNMLRAQWHGREISLESWEGKSA